MGGGGKPSAFVRRTYFSANVIARLVKLNSCMKGPRKFHAAIAIAIVASAQRPAALAGSTPQKRAAAQPARSAKNGIIWRTNRPYTTNFPSTFEKRTNEIASVTSPASHSQQRAGIFSWRRKN